MVNRIIISFGIAMLIGVAAGYLLSTEKYYYLDPEGPKREITKITSESEWYYKQATSIENAFNTTQAIIIGLGSFGGLLILSVVLKKRNTTNMR